MQSLIQMINLEEEEQILEEAIKDQIVDMAFEPNATHVLQKIIMCISIEKLDYIFYPIYDKLIPMSLDANGLCVVKKAIARFKTEDKKEMIYKALSENCMALVQSPFGNYAIQTAIETGSHIDCKEIYNSLLKNVLQLSMQKFSSNVIEKCIEYSNDET